MVENKTLVIIRHAHRNKSEGREIDNGLSAKGRKQARALAKIYSKMFKKMRPVTYSSPKLRCIETVEPIATKRNVPVQILDSLNEALTTSELRRKINDFDAFWRANDAKLMVVSSHGDWIPAYVKKVTGAEIDLDKGGWLQIEMITDRPQLRWIIQNPEL